MNKIIDARNKFTVYSRPDEQSDHCIVYDALNMVRAGEVEALIILAVRKDGKVWSDFTCNGVNGMYAKLIGLLDITKFSIMNYFLHDKV